MMGSESALAADFMVKRAQMKSRFTTPHYKSRWFVLTNRVLKYHEGTIQTGQGREKGRVNLINIKLVEEVEEESLGRANAFQVVYFDPQSSENYTLYVVSTTPEQRSKWVQLLRDAAEKCEASFWDKYHPGIWQGRQGRFNCCFQINKKAPGCQPAWTQPEQKNGSRLGNHSNMGKGSKPSHVFHGGAFPAIPSKQGRPGHSKSQSPTTYPRKKVQEELKTVLSSRLPNSCKKKCVALYDYERQEAEDLTLTRGEEYELMDDSKPHWWRVRNRRGEVGLIPATYVQVVDSLATYDWYYKECSRQQSEETLRRENKEGAFLVRDSSQIGMYTLSLFTKQTQEGLVKHYHIKRNENNEYYLSVNHAKSNIPELINYHRHNAGDDLEVHHYRIEFDTWEKKYFFSPSFKFASISELIIYHKHNAAGLVVRLRSPPSDRGPNEPPVSVFSEEWELDPNDFCFESEPLGSGQFGMVYKARWTPKRVDVAIKMMRENTMSEDDFVDEGRVMKELQHFNLVKLYGVCTRTRPIYLVTEFMKNGALLQYLKRHKARLQRQPTVMLDMCIQVGKAMTYLESKGFIHRDLAARNCLVGENYIIKVGDFGLARFVLDDEYTSSSGTKFPIKWSPPEVLGFTRFSTKSDVWAFGVLMWEIYTCGDMPYGRMKNPDVVEFISNSRRRLDQPLHCPEDVYNIMLECWQHDRDDRPPFHQILPNLEQLQDYVG